MTQGKVYGTKKLRKITRKLMDFFKMRQFEKKNPPKYLNNLQFILIKTRIQKALFTGEKCIMD